jgi:hypothetical protein
MALPAGKLPSEMPINNLFRDCNSDEIVIVLGLKLEIQALQEQVQKYRRKHDDLLMASIGHLDPD